MLMFMRVFVEKLDCERMAPCVRKLLDIGLVIFVVLTSFFFNGMFELNLYLFCRYSLLFSSNGSFLWTKNDLFLSSVSPDSIVVFFEMALSRN